MSHDKYLKDRLSYRIPSLLPEYLRDESPALESFLKAYFEYLEAEVLVFSSQGDIQGVQNEDGTGSILHEVATVSPSPDEQSSKILFDGFGGTPQSNPFSRGEYLVGKTSKSVAKIEVINGNILYLKSISGNGFAKGETVIGRQSTQTAVVKSYKENSILANNRLLDYSDIDRTTEDFLDYFIKDFMPAIDFKTNEGKLSSLRNKRLTVKNVQDLYKKKGTAESIQFLMRVLYADDATVRYPIDETIHVGESGYSQQRRMRVNITQGVPEANDKITQYDATETVIQAQAVIENVYPDVGDGNYSLEIMNNHVGTFIEGSAIKILDRDGITTLDGTVYGIIASVTTGSSTYVDHGDGDILLEDGAGLLLETMLNPFGSLYSLNDQINITGSKLDTDTTETKSVINGLTEGSIEEIMIETGGQNYEAGDLIIFEGGVGGNAEAIVGSTGDEVLLEGGSVFGHYEIIVTTSMINNPSTGKTLIGGPGVKDDNNNWIIFNDNKLDVYVDGILKTPTTDYTWKNDRVTFTTALTAGQLVELYTDYSRLTYEDGSVVDYNGVIHNGTFTADNGRIRSILMRDGGQYTEIPKVFPGGYVYLNADILDKNDNATTIENFSVGEIITGTTSNATGVISRIDKQNRRLIVKRLSTDTGVFQTAELITGGATTTKGTITQHNVSAGTGAKLFAFSEDIGGVASINIQDQGNKFNYDGLISGSSYHNILIKTPSANLLRDLVITGTLSGSTGKVVSYDADRHILTYRDLVGQFYDNEKVTFNISDSFYTIKSNNFDGRGLYAGEGIIEEQIVGDYGTLNANASRMQDGLLYQTHSYVVKVGESINKWRGIVKDLIHPAGHIVFGEVAIKQNVSSAMSSTFRPVIVITAEPSYNFALEGLETEHRDNVSEIMLETSTEVYVEDEDGNPTSELSHYDMRHNIILEEAPEQGAITYKRTIVNLYTLSSEVNSPFTILREAGQPAYNTDPRTGGSLTSFAMVDGIQTGEGTEMYDSMMRSRHWNINVINSFASAHVLNGARTGTPEVTHLVATASSGEYYFDGVQNKQLELNIGTTYHFSHPTSHPIRFSTTADGTHNSGTAYTTGITNGTGEVKFVTSSSTPTTLYYYCSAHSGMGGVVNLTATNHLTSLNLANKDNGWLVIETERRPSDKGKVIQLYTPSEEELILEDGGRIEIEQVSDYIRFEDRLAEVVYHVGEFGERIVSEDGLDLFNLETATTLEEKRYFVSERSIELESGGLYFEDGDRMVYETGQVSLQEGNSEVGITSFVPLGSTFRSLNTITGQQTYNIAYYLKDETDNDDILLENGHGGLMKEESNPEGLRVQDLSNYYPLMFVPEFENRERKRTNITYSAYIKSGTA